MRTMLVTYDLIGTGEKSSDYDRLIGAIENFRALRFQYSAWIIKTDSEVGAVRDYLWTFMDSDDRLFVGVLSGATAWQNASCGDAPLRELIVS